MGTGRFVDCGMKPSWRTGLRISPKDSKPCRAKSVSCANSPGTPKRSNGADVRRSSRDPAKGGSSTGCGDGP